MSENPSVESGATLRSFPATPLLSGRGATRELAADAEGVPHPRWMLHAVELRSAVARVGLPAHTRQLVAGVSGPQVSLAGDRAAVPIRREGVLAHDGPVLQLERSGFRGAMSTSVLLVLAYDAASVEARFDFAEVTGPALLPDDARVLIVLGGSLEVAGAALGPRGVLVIPRGRRVVDAGTARVVLLRVDPAD